MAEVEKQGEKAEPVSLKATNLVELPQALGVRHLAERLNISVIEVIKQLMRNGIMANINQVISYDTAAAVVEALGYEAHPQPLKAQVGTAEAEKQLSGKEELGGLPHRPSVVTIMGHVDHGKTRLLDAIRKTDVMAGEAGGITQHIGAYQVELSGQKITFLDTPGHEAFTAMRAHGAQVTDITILVVAADDGVMPQTLEAIDHARAAGVPIVVAINKIDRPGANIDRVKQQLAEADLVVEDWGGDTVCVATSAKDGTGIADLLENLLLVAELEDLRADPDQPAEGVVIEAELDKTRGPMATVLVKSGTLKVGDTMVAGSTWGRVKAMFNDSGKRVRRAEPAMPVAVLGLGSIPQVGDTLQAVAGERQARALVGERQAQVPPGSEAAVSLNNLYVEISAGHIKELNIIFKADVQGSIEPIRISLGRLGTDELKVRISAAPPAILPRAMLCWRRPLKGWLSALIPALRAGLLGRPPWPGWISAATISSISWWRTWIRRLRAFWRRPMLRSSRVGPRSRRSLPPGVGSRWPAPWSPRARSPGVAWPGSGVVTRLSLSLR